MDCPVCGEALRRTEKYGVEVEVCPDCKGIWLDRGELERIVQTAGADARTVSPERPAHEEDSRRQQSPGRDEYKDHERSGKKKRAGGLLGNLMDSLGGGED